jgi:hypothetical protein
MAKSSNAPHSATVRLKQRMVLQRALTPYVPVQVVCPECHHSAIVMVLFKQLCVGPVKFECKECRKGCTP